MTKVTYSPPNEPGHPASITWNNVVFHANVPVELDPIRHAYTVPITEKHIDEKTQAVINVTSYRRMPMAEIARTNPAFIVEGAPRAAVPIVSKQPTTPEEYRVHALRWIKAAEEPQELGERWEEEEDMRERCGVGDDDISYLQPIFDARFMILKMAAA